MDMQVLFHLVDRLNPQERQILVDYVVQKDEGMAIYTLSPQQIEAIEALMHPVHLEAEGMSDEEINTVIDEAIAEVRHERQTQNRF